MVHEVSEAKLNGLFEAQGIAPGFSFTLLANEGFRVAACCLGQR